MIGLRVRRAGLFVSRIVVGVLVGFALSWVAKALPLPFPYNLALYVALFAAWLFSPLADVVDIALRWAWRLEGDQ